MGRTPRVARAVRAKDPVLLFLYYQEGFIRGSPVFLRKPALCYYAQHSMGPRDDAVRASKSPPTRLDH